jgi:hypothetical protein
MSTNPQAVEAFASNFQAQAVVQNSGTYRAIPVSWTVNESEKEDSKSVWISMQFAIFQQWDAASSQWSQEWPSGYYVYGSQFIVKRDGSVSDGPVKALSDANLWFGNFDDFKEGKTPPKVAVIVEVEEEEYNGKTSMRVKWINPDADAPKARSGGLKAPDASKLESLRARFQSQTRAIAGPKGTGQATPPPVATSAPAPAATPAPVAAPAPAAPQPLDGGIAPPVLGAQDTPF